MDTADGGSSASTPPSSPSSRTSSPLLHKNNTLNPLDTACLSVQPGIAMPPSSSLSSSQRQLSSSQDDIARLHTLSPQAKMYATTASSQVRSASGSNEVLLAALRRRANRHSDDELLERLRGVNFEPYVHRRVSASRSPRRGESGQRPTTPSRVFGGHISPQRRNVSSLSPTRRKSASVVDTSGRASPPAVYQRQRAATTTEIKSPSPRRVGCSTLLSASTSSIGGAVDGNIGSPPPNIFAVCSAQPLGNSTGSVSTPPRSPYARRSSVAHRDCSCTQQQLEEEGEGGPDSGTATSPPPAADGTGESRQQKAADVPPKKKISREQENYLIARLYKVAAKKETERLAQYERARKRREALNGPPHPNAAWQRALCRDKKEKVAGKDEQWTTSSVSPCRARTAAGGGGKAAARPTASPSSSSPPSPIEVRNNSRLFTNVSFIVKNTTPYWVRLSKNRRKDDDANNYVKSKFAECTFTPNISISQSRRSPSPRPDARSITDRLLEDARARRQRQKDRAAGSTEGPVSEIPDLRLYPKEEQEASVRRSRWSRSPRRDPTGVVTTAWH
eukprot:PhM_4_TR9650/c0_g1_i1/m.53575